MRPTVRPTCGRRNEADYERRNAFLAFITNAADARPTHYEYDVRAADVQADYEPTLTGLLFEIVNWESDLSMIH